MKMKKKDLENLNEGWGNTWLKKLRRNGKRRYKVKGVPKEMNRTEISNPRKKVKGRRRQKPTNQPTEKEIGKSKSKVTESQRGLRTEIEEGMGGPAGHVLQQGAKKYHDQGKVRLQREGGGLDTLLPRLPGTGLGSEL